MISACPVRARVTARHITEHAEFAKVAEQGDNAQPRGTSVLLRDLGALRVLRVKAGQAARNAPTPRTPHP